MYNTRVTKPKIAFVMGSKFPTSKAYGVTTRETLISLINSTCEVKIFCHASDYFDEDFAKILNIISNYKFNRFTSLLIRLGERGANRFNQISWLIGTTIDLLLNIRLITSFKPELIWTRDPIIAYICLKAFPNIRILLEVHSNGTKFIYKTLSNHKNKIYFFPINIINDNFLKSIKTDLKTSLAPMAIRSEHLATESQIENLMLQINRKQKQNLRIGYIGNFAPQGYSKGIEDLIGLSKICQLKSNNFEITLIGCTDSEKKFYEMYQKKLNIKVEYLKFMTHLRHSEARIMMNKFDILVLPLPKDAKYTGMPLKLLEYLAAGRVTLVANSVITTSVFQGEFKPYYYLPGDSMNLFDSIHSAISDSQLKDNICLGVEFASQFTWKLRTDKMLSIALSMPNV
jgi:glycosyltransferase involved in cell wall biosynthesis